MAVGLAVVLSFIGLQAGAVQGQGYGAPATESRHAHELPRPPATWIADASAPGVNVAGIRYPDVAYPHPAATPQNPGIDHGTASDRYPLGSSVYSLPASSDGGAEVETVEGPIGDETIAWPGSPMHPGCDGEISFSSCVSPGVSNCNGACGPCAPRSLPWFGATYALLMQRSAGELRYVTDDLGAATRVLSNRDAPYNYQTGTEFRIGRRLPGCWAIEAAWWGLSDSSSAYEIWGADYTGLATRLDFEGLEIDQGAATSEVNDYYDGAENHRIARSFSATNVELNLLCIPMNCIPCSPCSPCTVCSPCACPTPSPLTMSWNLGVRYLQLEEAFRFWGDAVDTSYGDPVDEIYYNIDVENQLIGAQAGGHMHFCLCRQFAIFSDINAGLYGNRIHSSQRVSNPEGYAYANNGAYLNQAYNLHSGANGVSMVAELRLGSHFQLTPRWRTTFAYRLMGVTGVALPEDQIPDYFDDYVDAQRIRKDGGLLLHGFMFGIEHRF